MQGFFYRLCFYQTSSSPPRVPVLSEREPPPPISSEPEVSPPSVSRVVTLSGVCVPVAISDPSYCPEVMPPEVVERDFAPLLLRPVRLAELLFVAALPLRVADERDALLLVADEPLRVAAAAFLGAAAFFVREAAALDAPLRAGFEADFVADLEPPRADLDAVLRDDFAADLEPPREDFDAVLRDDFAAALEPPREDLDADFLPPRADFDAPPREDFDADLEALREDLPAPAREDLEADLDFDLLLDAPRPEDEPPEPELPPREDFDAFLEAPFLEELRPELLLADFLEAAFLVDFAMLMVFRVRVNN
jgi:hypothetical protein